MAATREPFCTILRTSYCYLPKGREGGSCELRLYGVLRRVMCNDLDQKVRQVTQRSPEGTVDPLGAGVGCDFGGQSCQQPSQGLGSVAFEPEEILELPDHPFHDLALAGGPAPIGLRPSPAGVVLRGGRHQRPVALQPVALPL